MPNIIRKIILVGVSGCGTPRFSREQAKAYKFNQEILAPGR
jgi:hypothetical protein